MPNTATLNADVFTRSPEQVVIPNQGVATLLIPSTPKEWEVLHWELSSFVAEGQYEVGLDKIISSFLSNLDKAEQPSWWISGFYGSGKSHFVRVLEYLWSDPKFPADSPQAGASSRGLVELSQRVKDHLTELSAAGRRAGGLWSASGSLASGANGTVRLAFLEILFRAAGLPGAYPQARLELWLRQQGVFAPIRQEVEQTESWRSSLNDMYVSPVLAAALGKHLPDFDVAQARAMLLAQFPPVTDVNDEETQTVTEDVLELVGNRGQIPLTLIVLDEVQQFIGDSVDRALQVQLLTELLSKRFGGRLMLVATGQSAMGATPQLERIRGRFPKALELSNADVNNVIRQVVLRKKPDRMADVQAMLERASGEVSRHLEGTRLASRPEDTLTIVQDYPVLPCRRRFWDEFLQAIDRQGSNSQLRRQLAITLSATQSVAKRPLGEVVGADQVFDELAPSMLNSSFLLQDTHTLIMTLNDGTADGILRQRLARLIFMISKLDAAAGLRPTEKVLADLLVEDLNSGSVGLRQRLPGILAGMEKQGQLMLTEGEYRLQTREGSEWEGDYQNAYQRLLNDDVRQLQERDRLLKAEVETQFKGNLSETQGESKTPRKAELHFTQSPPPVGQTVPIWVRDEGHASAGEVQQDALKTGSESPLVFMYLPDTEKQKLKEALAVQLAAAEVLAKRPNPNTPEAKEAWGAMNTRTAQAQQTVQALVSARVAAARVFQGGGQEVAGGGVKTNLKAAVQAALARLYGKFADGDNARWDSVLRRAKTGDHTALDALGYTAEPTNQPVLRSVLNDIGAGKKGSEVRRTFTQPPYGWPQDAVDSALVLLTLLGNLKALHNGSPIEAKALDAAKLTASEFRPETVTLSKLQQIAVRGVYQDAGLTAVAGQETAMVPVYLKELERLLQASGGLAPLPDRLSTALLTELQDSSGNAQLLRIAELKDDLKALRLATTERAELIARQQDAWQKLGQLLRHSQNEEHQAQADAILSGRQLLLNPDPVLPLANEVMNGLRAGLNAATSGYATRYQEHLAALHALPEWSQLEGSQQENVLRTSGVKPAPDLKLSGITEVVSALNGTSLSEWESRTVALKPRFEKMQEEVFRLVQPKAVRFNLPRRTLNDQAELDTYLNELREGLLKSLGEGNPVTLV